MRQFLRSVGYAAQGFRYAFRTQRNMVIHCIAAVLLGLLAIWLRLSTLEWALLLLAAALVITSELVNTAVENAVDLSSPTRHPLAKTAKDTAAAAVLVAAVFAVAIGLLILAPPLLERFIR